MADLHTTTRELRLIASLRAKNKLLNKELAAAVIRMEFTMPDSAGAASVWSTTTTATTTINSISVKPAPPNRPCLPMPAPLQ